MRPVVALAVVVGVIVPTVAIAERVGTSAQSPVAHSSTATAPLVGARLVCPDAIDRTVGRVSRVTRLGVAVATTSASGPGRGVGAVTVTKLGAAKPSAPVLTVPGRARVLTATPYQGDVVIDGEGSLAPGLSGEVLGRRDGGPYRGLDGVACTAPLDNAWLIGANTGVGAHAELRLANTDDVTAVVNIGLYSTSGVVNVRNALGLAVKPHATRIIPLETLAPAQSLLMVRVRATSGRVAVALRQQLQSASTPNGNDFIPLAAAPSRSAVVPGLTAGLGPRRILIGNPGDLDATASIRLIRSDSAFVPRGLATVTVPAGGTVSVDVTKPLANAGGAALVTADHAVVAGASMNTGPRVDGFAEQAFSAASSSLTGPASAVVNYVRFRVSQLILTAPGSAATVRITTLGGVGPSAGHSASVRVGAGRSVVYDLTSLAHGQLLVAVTVTPAPGSAPVYVARDEFEFGSHGPMFTVLPLASPPLTSVVPSAALDTGAGLPTG